MSERTRQLVCWWLNKKPDLTELKDDDLPEDDEQFNEEVAKMYPAVNFGTRKGQFDPSSSWKCTLMELCNSLTDDKHPQSNDFMSATIATVSGVRQGPLIAWMKDFLELISKDPKASL